MRDAGSEAPAVTSHLPRELYDGLVLAPPDGDRVFLPVRYVTPVHLVATVDVILHDGCRHRVRTTSMIRAVRAAHAARAAPSACTAPPATSVSGIVHGIVSSGKAAC